MFPYSALTKKKKFLNKSTQDRAQDNFIPTPTPPLHLYILSFHFGDVLHLSICLEWNVSVSLVEHNCATFRLIQTPVCPRWKECPLPAPLYSYTPFYSGLLSTTISIASNNLGRVLVKFIVKLVVMWVMPG